MPHVYTRKIIVAVDAGDANGLATADSAERIASYTRSLARRTKASLHFVTVLDSSHPPSWVDVPSRSVGMLSRYDLYHALRLAREGARKRLGDELRELADSTNLPGTTHAVVEANDAAQGIVAEAVSRGGDMIVLGTTHPSHRRVLRGYSTALSVMSTAPIPVMVVPDGFTELSQGRLRLLLTDDLTEQGMIVLRHGMSLASQLGEVDVDHLHVLAPAPSFFFRSVQEADVRRACTEQLQQRKDDLGIKLQEGGEYFASTRTGEVPAVVADVVEERAPHLVVFGRHRAVSLQPLKLGRMSASAMLDLDHPILSVPET